RTAPNFGTAFRGAQVYASEQDDVQPIGTDPGPADTASPPIPDDDYEALLVARFAAEHDSSSESEQPTEAKPSEPIAFSLFRFLKDNAVHEVLSQALALKGLETVEDLAYAYPDLASLDSLLSSLSDDDMSEMGAADALHGVQAARLRRALRAAHGLSHQAHQPPPTPAAETLPS
ncbi:unnamed protein product, partial [Symbiodinium sp. CCMP2456]